MIKAVFQVKGKGTTENGGNTGYVLALKGTAGGKDLFITDGADIVHDGLAHHQIVDLHNFWKQIKTKEGETYRAAKIMEVDEVITHKLIESYKNSTDSEKEQQA